MGNMTTHYRQHSNRLQSLNDHNQRYLVRIAFNNRQVTIIATFNTRGTRHISTRSIQHSLVSMGYRSRTPVNMMTPDAALCLV